MGHTIMNRAFCIALIGSGLMLAGCQTPGEDVKANVYTSDQANSRQEAKVINILAVLPAKIQVDNTQNQRTAQLMGGLLGAAAGGALGGGLAQHNALAVGTVGAVGGGAAGVVAGSLVPGKVLVDGVSITYEDAGHTYNSAQVGRLCEFVPGHAIIVETSPTVTRIQSNASCPVQGKA
jgi:outer membrane lipoprotein SlyB